MKRGFGCFLFLNFSMLLLGIGIGIFFYDKINTHELSIMPSNNSSYNRVLSDSEEQNQITKIPEYDEKQTVNTSSIITQKTEFIIQEYQVNSDEYEEKAIRVPGKYVGMTREEYTNALKDYEDAPGLVQKEKGFQGAEVIAFSSERVVTKYYYERQDSEPGYYVIVLNDMVVVMDENMEDIYMNTGIYLHYLPYEVQLEIMNCKYLFSEKELYNFLESYTS